MSGLVCVAGGKGSPGVTTLALMLTRLDERGAGVVLVDADPDGGDLAPLLGVSTNPGLVTLAAAARRGFDASELDRHLQPVGPSMRLLAGPSSAEQSAAALSALGSRFAESLSSIGAVADVGRWRPGSATCDLLRAADVVVLVVHPTVAGVSHARFQFQDLSSRCRRVVVACRGERPYGPDEVADAIGCESVTVLPVDRVGASMVDIRRSQRWLRRSPLARSAGVLARRLGSVEEVAS